MVWNYFPGNMTKYASRFLCKFKKRYLNIMEDMWQGCAVYLNHFINLVYKGECFDKALCNFRGRNFPLWKVMWRATRHALTRAWVNAFIQPQHQ